jgi:thioredoxin 1
VLVFLFFSIKKNIYKHGVLLVVMAYKEIVTKDDFNAQVVESDKISVVDFWAPWCGPCKEFGPVFERVSEEISDVNFVKVNVDEAIELASQFGIRSIPTIIIVKDGKVLDQRSGGMDDDQFSSWIKEQL